MTIRQKKNSYKRFGIVEVPENYTLVELGESEKVMVVFYEYDIGHFLIVSPTRRRAYDIANIIRGYLSVFPGWLPYDNDSMYYLQELNAIPNPEWTEEDLFNALDPEVHSGHRREETFRLRQVSYVLYPATDDLKQFLMAAHNHDNIAVSLLNLIQSRRFFCGYMSPSYYDIHYSREILELTAVEREKSYLENRTLYEAAF